MSSPQGPNSTSKRSSPATGAKSNYAVYGREGLVRPNSAWHRLPWYRRYQRALIITGSIGVACFVWSAPIYYFFRTPPENEDPRLSMWPGEIAMGKTYAQQFRERVEKKRADKEAAKAARGTIGTPEGTSATVN